MKLSRISLALAAACVPGLSQAAFIGDIEVTGYLKNETAIFVQDGQTIGQADTMLDRDGNDAGDLLKFENSARFFFNGGLGENASWHGDLNIICDSEGVNSDYKCHESYTQNDWLRELYVDASLSDWAFRLGKQQVVWGTADGIKLLDIINPTDFRELSQNTMADSRIPVWMINAERNIGDSGNIQFIVSEARANAIPGLNKDGDHGQPFIMQGVDSITGDVNGFLHVAPALADVAGSFSAAAFLGGINGQPSPLGLVPVTGLTVDAFASSPLDVFTAPGAILLPGHPLYDPNNTVPGYLPLNNIAQNGLFDGDPNGNNNVTNLMPVTGPQFFQVGWNPNNPTSAFEYMPNATFATFNTFSFQDANSPTGFSGATSKYIDDTPDTSANAGLRYKGSTEGGLNYSVNYFYHYSANPDINMSWHDAVTHEELTVQRALPGDFINNGTGAPGPDGIPDLSDLSTNLAANEIPNGIVNPFTDAPTILLHNSAGEYYGAFDPTAGFGGYTTNPVYLAMREDWHRVHSMGGSFDYAFDTEAFPVVLRGEFLYDKDEKQPVVDKRLLGVGDLSNALRMEDADYFKYVLGVDITVLTNMLVSGQFIQFRNLDFVSDSRTCSTQTGISYDCSQYTGDFSTLSMTNGLNKGWENKEFYSLFFSKPFGESQLGRWNNITIYEEGDGWWNRFDVEYSFTDQLLVTGELNLYWGDENTTFGPFENSSNAQVGVKYIWH